MRVIVLLSLAHSATAYYLPIANRDAVETFSQPEFLAAGPTETNVISFTTAPGQIFLPETTTTVQGVETGSFSEPVFSKTTQLAIETASYFQAPFSETAFLATKTEISVLAITTSQTNAFETTSTPTTNPDPDALKNGGFAGHVRRTEAKVENAVIAVLQKKEITDIVAAVSTSTTVSWHGSNATKLPCSSKLTAKATGSIHCVTHTVCKAMNTLASSHSNSTKHATQTFKPTAKAASTPAAAACTALSLTTSNVTLPFFPLSANTTSALSSFLNLILSVPESVLAKSDKDVSTFFTGLGGCLASNGKGLENDLKALTAPLASFLTNIGANIITGAGEGVKEAGKDAKNIVADVDEGVKEAGKKIADKIGGLFHFTQKDKRDAAAFTTLLGDVEKIAVCMNNVANNSTVFDVARCAVDIGLLALPVGRLTNIRNLVGAAGGVVKVVKDLKEGKSAGVVAGDSVKVLEEAMGIATVVKACSFVVEDVKKAI